MTMARIDAPEKPGPLTRLAWWIAKRQTGGKLAEPVALMAHSPLLMNAYGGFEMAFDDRLRRRFDEPQIVELTWAAAIENLRARFNWALGIESQGYAEGAVCVRPEVRGRSAGEAEERPVSSGAVAKTPG
jgi:hypothetical protein